MYAREASNRQALNVTSYSLNFRVARRCVPDDSA